MSRLGRAVEALLQWIDHEVGTLDAMPGGKALMTETREALAEDLRAERRGHVVCPHCGHRGTSGNDSAFFHARMGQIDMYRRTRKQKAPSEWCSLLGCPRCKKVFISDETEVAE